jgi:hypothetical protein
MELQHFEGRRVAHNQLAVVDRRAEIQHRNRYLGASPSERRCQRNRWFADSPLEEAGFELSVPPGRGELISLRKLTSCLRGRARGHQIRMREP